MTLFQAVVMGLIQGLTEFLPVSSSGHLALFKALFGFDADTGILFDVMLHIGTLAAICAVYHRDVASLILSGLRILRDLFVNLTAFFARLLRRDPSIRYRQVFRGKERRFVWLILLSTVPTGILGLLLKDFVERASETTLIPGICLLVTAVILLISDRLHAGRKDAATASWADAFVIGLVQGIATLPGISRSGSTITAGLLCGFSRSFAVKYSFLMSIPAILGAAVLEIPDLEDAVSAPDTPFGYYLLGTVIAAAVGYLCIRLMLRVVNKKKFSWFALYCAAAGAVSIVLALV